MTETNGTIASSSVNDEDASDTNPSPTPPTSLLTKEPKENDNVGDEVEASAEPTAKITTNLRETTPSAKKKRGADRQITKDEFVETNSDESVDEEKLKEGFQKANADVLKTRRIVRARWPRDTPAVANTSNTDSINAKEKKITETKKNDESDDHLETKEKDKKEEMDEPAAKINPFASISFSSTGSSNPFVAGVDKASTTKITDSTSKETSTTTALPGVFGSQTGFGKGVVFGSTALSTRSTNNLTTASSSPTIKPLFGATSSNGTLFGQAKTSRGFGSATLDASISSGFGSSPSSSTNTNSKTDPKSYFFGNGVKSSLTVLSSSATSTPFGISTKNENQKVEALNSSTIAPGIISEVSNGEEGEKCVFQVRAKLFKLIPAVKESAEEYSTVSSSSCSFINNNSGSKNVASVPPTTTMGTSVPHSNGSGGSSINGSSNRYDDSKQQEGNGEQSKMETGGKGNSSTEKAGSRIVDSSKTGGDKTWKEVGIGPVRILERQFLNSPSDEFKSNESGKKEEKKKYIEKEDISESLSGKFSVRIVQRRESTPGGQGTKLILNIRLHSECQVSRQSEKYVRLATCEEVETSNKEVKNGNVSLKAVHYLFKVKTILDADELQRALESGITLCGKA